MSSSQLRVLILASMMSFAFACGDDSGLADGGDGGLGGDSSIVEPGLSCGPGTTEKDGKCVSMPGTRLTCAEGTFEHMGECVAVDPGDKTAPKTTANPLGGRFLTLPAFVALTTDEPAKIYYTTDGSEPDTTSDFQPSPAVITPVTDGMEVRFFAVDPAGNTEDLQRETYEQTATPPPPVTDVAVEMNNADATITWKTPAEADGVVVVQLGDGATASPTTGESYKKGDKLGSGTVVYVGTAEEFTAADLPVGVTSFLIYTYNDVLLYSGGVLARSGEIALPVQEGTLTVDVMDTSVTVDDAPSDLKVTANNVVYDGGGMTVSVDIKVKNNADRPIYLPKFLVKGAELAAGGDATVSNSQGKYPITVGVLTGGTDVSGLTLPSGISAQSLSILSGGNGAQTVNFADPGFTGTTPASLIKYINDNTTGITAKLNATDQVVLTNMPPGSGKCVAVDDVNAGTTLGFSPLQECGTDLAFIYLCPDDPEADDDALIDDRTLCMRALQPGETVTKTIVFGNVVADSVITVDFEVKGNRLAVGGDNWKEFDTTYPLNSQIPLFDTRANQSTGYFVNDPLATGPQNRWRTTAWVLSPDGFHAFVGSKVSLRVTTYDLRTSRVVGGADLESGRGHVADMKLGSDGFLYALLNLNQHEYRWSTNANGGHSREPSEALLLRLDPTNLEELARAQVDLPRMEYTAPATYTTTVDLSGLTLPTDIAAGTLEVSVNGAMTAQVINFASPMFTGTTATSLAAFIVAHSTGIKVSVDMADHLVFETEKDGYDETFQFNTTAAATTLGIDNTLHGGDETATNIQDTDSHPPRAKRMDITDDASMLAFGVVQSIATRRNGTDIYGGEVYFVDLATMSFVDMDKKKKGMQPVVPAGAIDPDDTNLDEIVVGPTTVAFSPNGKKLFVAGDDEVDTDMYVVAAIDVASGKVTFKEIDDMVNDAGKRLWRRPDGKVWLMTWNELYEVDPSDGEMTLISDSVASYNAFTPGIDGNYFAKEYAYGMAEIAPDGTQLYFANYGMCRSQVGSSACDDSNMYNYGKSMITTPY